MKAVKYIALALAIVMVLLVTGWYLRNTLIERISNPILAQYGLTVTDVSLDALATRDARISYLELRHVNGMIIGINGLRLPLRSSPTGVRTFRAASIEITLPDDDDEQPLAIAEILNQVLSLPQQLPRNEFIVGEISAAPYPAVRDMYWQVTETQQRLTAIVDVFFLSATLRRTSDTDHLLGLTFANIENHNLQQSFGIEIRRNDTGVLFNGSGLLDLRIWSPMIAMLGVDAVTVESGTATLRFDGEFANDPNQIPFVNVDFTPTTTIALDIGGFEDALSSVTIESASTTEISAAITDLQWSLRQSAMVIGIADNRRNALRVSLSELSCNSGNACSGAVQMVGENLVLPFAAIERFELRALQDLTIGENVVKVSVRSDATLDIRGVTGPDVQFARLDTKLTSDAEFEFTGSDWRASARSADIRIDDYVLDEGLTFSAPVFLDEVSVSQSGGQSLASARFHASRASAGWNDRRIRLPGARGRVSRKAAEVAVRFETAGLQQEGSVEVNHNLDRARGRLSMTRDAALSFASNALSSRISPWDLNWDLRAGTVEFGLIATWQKTQDQWRVGGQASILASGLAGAWEDTAFAGVTTRIEAAYDPATGIAISPSTIQVALVDMGLPVENITADYALHPDGLAVDVSNLRMTAFGGVITADPFSFRTASDSNNLILHVASVDLARVLAIEEFEAIEISGRVGAELPVTIEGKTVTIKDGKLTGVAPGGVIRYRPGIPSGSTGASGIAFATRALGNFQYDSLTSQVDYVTNGDLKLQMRLTGRNPDLESGRPIILNLGVENNVPQMLRSLQAARAVEEVLEKRLKQ